MIEIRYEVNGKRVRPNDVAGELEPAILKETGDRVAKALASVTCPEHGQRPKVTIKGQTLNDLSWEITGCCDALVQLALKKLAE